MSLASRFLKAVAPYVALNTLDSSPGCPPRTQQPSTACAPTRPHAPKRQKVHPGPRIRGLDDEISDTEQDVASRTERRGSQSSLVHSVSPGISEYQSVEASTRQAGRSNRRNRRSKPNGPPVLAHPAPRGHKRRHSEIMESFEELAPAPRPAAKHQRTARLVATSGTKANGAIRDPADEGILGKPMRTSQYRHSLGNGRKRSFDEISDDQDELVKATSGGRSWETSARLVVEDSPERDPPSLSRRGDLKPTRWTSKPSHNNTAAGVSVRAAVCQPNLRYTARGENSGCFLRPTNVTELRAYTHDGNKTEQYDWLKITGAAKTLFWHRDCNIIKVNQSMDQASSPISIGGLMLLKLSSNHEASWVAEWARKNLRMRVEEIEKRKLVVTWDKTHESVSQARTDASSRRRSNEISAPSRTIEEPLRESVALPDSHQTIPRTPIRHQMQVSTQPQTPWFAHTAPVTYGSRSTRSRQHIDQPQIPVPRRWSEEHPDWAKDWKMPLVFNRTTVDKDDVPRLDEGQCLNDNLIGYGLRYLFDELSSRHKDLHSRVYLHNSFFYEKLKAGRGAINYDGVKNWTAKVDLLSYDYIVVPVNEHFHWWVAIICNPGKLDPDSTGRSDKPEGPTNQVEGKAERASPDVELTDSAENLPAQSPRLPHTVDGPGVVRSDIVDLVSDDKNVSVDSAPRPTVKQIKKPGTRTYNPEDPRIITLDSMGSTHPQAVAHLKKYLLAEFEHKRNKVITDLPQQLGMKATNIPEQNNLCDCGIYLLGYIQEFVKNPDSFIQTLLRKERPEWKFNPSELRVLWRDTIQVEQRLYQNTQLRAAQKKREASAAKRTPKGSVEPSRHTSRETSEVGNASNSKLGNGMEVAGQSPPAQANTPARPNSHEVDISAAKQATRNPGLNGTEEPSSSAAVATHSPQQHSPRQDGNDEDPRLGNTNVLPSIEAADAESTPGPCPPTPDEPDFLAQIPSSSLSDADDDDEDDDNDAVTEVDPSSFYTSSAAKSRSGDQRMTAHSSPAAGQHRRAPQPGPNHTGSRFVIAGSPELDPVVESAEVVRRSEPIDLT